MLLGFISFERISICGNEKHLPKPEASARTINIRADHKHVPIPEDCHPEPQARDLLSFRVTKRRSLGSARDDKS
jgi:hypothetical protein